MELLKEESIPYRCGDSIEWKLTEDKMYNKVHLTAKGFVREKDKIYFSDLELCILFQLDLRDYSIKVLCDFSNYQNAQLELYAHHIIRNNDDIILIPEYSDQVGIYNTQTKESRMISIGQKTPSVHLLPTIAVIERKIWIFPIATSNGVYILYMDNYEVIKDDNIGRKLKKYQYVYRNVRTIYENSFYMIASNPNCIIKIDIAKNDVEEIRIPFSQENLSILEQWREHLWFNRKENHECDIYEWIPERNELITYQLQDKELSNEYKESGLPPYVRFLFVNDDVYILGWGIRAILKISKERGLIEKAFDFPENFRILGRNLSYYPYFATEIIENKILFFPCISNMFLIYDTITGKVEGKEIIIEKDKIPGYQRWLSAYFINSITQEEGENLFTLYDCLEYEQYKQDSNKEQRENIGRLIWRALDDE